METGLGEMRLGEMQCPYGEASFSEWRQEYGKARRGGVLESGRNAVVGSRICVRVVRLRLRGRPLFPHLETLTLDRRSRRLSHG